MITLGGNPKPWAQVPFLPWDPPYLTPRQPVPSPQAGPEHLRSARGLSMEPGPLTVHPPSSSLLKGKRCYTARLRFPKTTLKFWRRKENPTIKGSLSMKYLVSSKKTQQKDLPLTNRKEVRSYWISTYGLQGNQWKSREGLDFHPHNRSHHIMHISVTMNCRSLWKLTNSLSYISSKAQSPMWRQTVQKTDLWSNSLWLARAGREDPR